MIELLGPFDEARLWLLVYLEDAKFKNEVLEGSLAVDWTPFSHAKCAYLLGSIWGRLRAMDSSLENSLEYAELVNKGLGLLTTGCTACAKTQDEHPHEGCAWFSEREPDG